MDIRVTVVYNILFIQRITLNKVVDATSPETSKRYKETASLYRLISLMV